PAGHSSLCGVTQSSASGKANSLELRLDSYPDSSQHLGLPETTSLWLDIPSLVGAINCAAPTSAAFRISSSGIASNTVPPISTVRHSESPQTEQHWLPPILAPGQAS